MERLRNLLLLSCLEGESSPSATASSLVAGVLHRPNQSALDHGGAVECRTCTLVGHERGALMECDAGTPIASDDEVACDREESGNVNGLS